MECYIWRAAFHALMGRTTPDPCLEAGGVSGVVRFGGGGGLVNARS